MTIDLHPLADWIEASLGGQSDLTRSALASQNAQLGDFVENCGLFRKAGHLSEIGCSHCEPSHLCKVVGEGENRFKAHCLLNGWYPLDAAEVTLLAFDRGRLIDMLRLAFGFGRTPAAQFAEGRLVQLGLVTGFAGAKDFMLGYADMLQSESVITSVIEALGSTYRQGPGIILTPSPVAENLPLPGQHKLLSLGRAFQGEARSVRPLERIFLERLGERRRERLAPGAKGQKAISFQIWQIEHKKRDWPSDRFGQADRIAARWPKETPRTIEIRTIQNHLPEFESGRYPRSTD